MAQISVKGGSVWAAPATAAGGRLARPLPCFAHHLDSFGNIGLENLLMEPSLLEGSGSDGSNSKFSLAANARWSSRSSPDASARSKKVRDVQY